MRRFGVGPSNIIRVIPSTSLPPPAPVVAARELGQDGCPASITAPVQAIFNALDVYPFYRVVKGYWQSAVAAPFPSGNGTYLTFDGAKLVNTITNGTGGCPVNLSPIPLGTTAWVSIDIEAPYDDALTGDGAYNLDDATEMAEQIYEPVIAGVRALLPNAQISLYNMTRMGPAAPGTYSPERWVLVQELHKLCHGIDPSMWRHSQFVGDFNQDFNVTSKRLLNAFIISGEQGKPIHCWATALYSDDPLAGLVPLGEQRLWYDIWSAYDIAGYWIFHGETDVTLPPILADSLAETPITLP